MRSSASGYIIFQLTVCLIKQSFPCRHLKKFSMYTSTTHADINYRSLYTKHYSWVERTRKRRYITTDAFESRDWKTHLCATGNSARLPGWTGIRDPILWSSYSSAAKTETNGPVDVSRKTTICVSQISW